jgi:hypothetical protein
MVKNLKGLKEEREGVFGLPQGDVFYYIGF